MTILISTDLKKSKKQLHKMNKMHFSQDHEVLVLDKKIAEFRKGTTWLVKKNQLDWIINEYIASKLYQWQLGADLISSTALFRDDSTGKVKIATELKLNYLKNFIPVDLNYKAGDLVMLDCIKLKKIKNKSCRIAHDNKQLKVENIEKSLIVSKLFDDGDLGHFVNFAILISNNRAILTRYDFDDSLKFLEVNVTQGFRLESVSQAMIDKIIAKNEEPQSFIDLLKYLNPIRDFAWNSLFGTIGSSNNYLLQKYLTNNPHKLLKVISEILKKDVGEISSIIHEAMIEVSSLVDDATLQEYYNFDKLNESGLYNGSDLSTSDKLELYLVDTLNERFKKLETMYTCLKAEIAHKEGEQLDLTDYTDVNIECVSPFTLKSFNLQDLFIESEL